MIDDFWGGSDGARRGGSPTPSSQIAGRCLELYSLRSISTVLKTIIMHGFSPAHSAKQKTGNNPVLYFCGG